MSKIILAFVGMPGSGKGTCTTYLESTYKWPLIHFGNTFYDELKKQGFDTVKDENMFRKKLRAEHGPAVLAKLVAARTDKFLESVDIVVLDGLYSWGELVYLREQYGDRLVVIAVAAARQERYRRILERQDSHRKYTSKEQIQAREVAEIQDIDKGGPIALADYTLVNDTTPEDMIAKLEGVLKQLALS